MTFREISQSLKNRLKAKELRDMLDGLVDGGDLDRREDQPPAGGHKIKSYRVSVERPSPGAT